MAEIIGTGADDTLHGTSDKDLIKGGGGHDRLYGHEGVDTLSGYDGDDWLDGGSGADKLLGGKGYDIYWVDNALDNVIELAGEGYDAVQSSVDYALPAYVEQLVLVQNTQDLDGYGNDLDNVICGNLGDNVLKGGAGDDLIFNALIYQSGNDAMYGGLGDDTYWVGTVGTTVIEYAGQGIDKVVAYISWTLPAHVEDLELEITSQAVNGTGNSSNNTIWGNSVGNVLSGGFGDDKLYGKDGDDTLVGGAGADLLDGGAGSDTISYVSSSAAVLVNLGNGMTQGGDAAGDTFDNATVENLTGSIYHDSLFGSGLANRLDGGGGNDYLWGGFNADQFEFSFAAAGWFGHDTVGDFAQGEDKIRLDDAQFANFAAVQAKMSQVGADTVITYDGANSIKLQNISAAGLAASDFLFF
jgi:Ca2+-binding RTX toxin-like protein